MVFQDSTGESLAEAVGTSISTSLRHANFCLPGVVDSFDPATGRADVQPALDQITSIGDAMPRPIIFDVPVVYPRGGGFSLTFPLAPDDPVLLVFSQRGLTEFKERLATGTSTARSLPDSRVFFALKDAVAIPGFISGPVSSTDLEITTPGDQLANIQVNGHPLADYIKPRYATLVENVSVGVQGDWLDGIGAGQWTEITLSEPLTTSMHIYAELRSSTASSARVVSPFLAAQLINSTAYATDPFVEVGDPNNVAMVNYDAVIIDGPQVSQLTSIRQGVAFVYKDPTHIWSLVVDPDTSVVTLRALDHGATAP